MADHKSVVSQETGIYAEFQTAVLRALPRDIDSDVALGWTNNSESLSRILREVLIPKGKSTGNSCRISVNYDIPIEDAINSGHYDWKNSNITSKNFPTARTGKIEIEVELIHFNRIISTKGALSELNRMGYRPIELHELLAFGKRCPNAQREFPIVALGSVWRDRDGDRYVPCLRRDGSGRDLNLYWIGSGWDGIYRFATVRK